MSVAFEFRAIIDRDIKQIKTKMERRCYRAANELRNAALQVLNGRRSGRLYHNSDTGQMHRASAPGEPPAVRNGTFYKSWEPFIRCDGVYFESRIESHVNVNGYILGSLLEYGTGRMAPRPHHEKIRQKALPKIHRIYAEPYF